MLRTALRLGQVGLLAGLLAASLPAQSRFDLYEVGWTLSPDPGGESIAMEMRLDPLHDRDRLVLRVPLWRPGSYRYFNYQQRISNLEATDQDGAKRAMLELDPRTWEVDVRGATSLTVRYDLATDNEGAEGALPAIHLHSPASFLYLEDALELPHTLKLELPRGWGFASGHRPDPHAEGQWRSPNYDVFVDCPIALGGLERLRFESHGKQFEVVLFGLVPTEEEMPRDDWLRRVRAISETAYDIVGDYPFERYVYLFLFNSIGGGYGLEHLNSTSIIFNHRQAKAGRLASLESVTAHEFFHLWNVKRIRPEQLGPFDYSQDVRTNDLWWLEGVTSYYNDLILQRSGLREDQPDWFWTAQARNFQGLLAQNGYMVVSPERASWTVWDPNPRANVSYYTQGQSLGLVLDAKIRIETGNRRSLDDVVRFLHRWVDYPDAGYREGDLERAIRAVTGWDCSAFFDRHVSGLVDLPWEEVMPLAGLDVSYMRKGAPLIGFSIDDDLQVEVTEAGPAHEAGLRDGDRLLRVSGVRIESRADLREAILELPAGKEAEVEVRRGSTRKKIRVPVRERSRATFMIRPDQDAEGLQAEIRDGILTGTPGAV